MDSNRRYNGGDNRGNNRGGTRWLIPLSTIFTISFNPLVVWVNKKGSLLLKA